MHTFRRLASDAFSDNRISGEEKGRKISGERKKKRNGEKNKLD